MDKTLTVPEIGAILRISRPMAYRVVNQPGFPKIYLGRSIRIPESAFQRWLADQAEGEDGK